VHSCQLLEEGVDCSGADWGAPAEFMSQMVRVVSRANGAGLRGARAVARVVATMGRFLGTTAAHYSSGTPRACSGRMVVRVTMALLVVLAAASGCVPSSVIGPLQHEGDERIKLVTRTRNSGVSEETLNAVVPPLTPEETQSIEKENDSCRASYLWKNGLTWTGSLFVATAAGVTIGGAYATGNNDLNAKIAFGVGAGSLAALGAGLVAIGGLIQQGFTDRGCWVRSGKAVQIRSAILR
jgi:hypothetical protein